MQKDKNSAIFALLKKLAQHLCAFSNQEDGGFLVFGVNNDASTLSITKEKADEIIKTLGNIALNNLSQSIQIQHNFFIS